MSGMMVDWQRRYASVSAERDIYAENRRRAYQAAQTIKAVLVCIGGPLNDNVGRYNAKQLATMRRICDLAEEIIGETA